ncbi:hypothetical protein HaLaN_13272 [Haematococcus lacustris]|uniref:Uncharacterized protein n=1 Tax=Haematococcus lacustris TaxID=44745 RepID=A0A699Z3X5_HAELA|nr:hypothetical protein HaLaN_13272 [Haematococcus lacustris]
MKAEVQQEGGLCGEVQPAGSQQAGAQHDEQHDMATELVTVKAQVAQGAAAQAAFSAKLHGMESQAIEAQDAVQSQLLGAKGQADRTANALVAVQAQLLELKQQAGELQARAEVQDAALAAAVVELQQALASQVAGSGSSDLDVLRGTVEQLQRDMRHGTAQVQQLSWQLEQLGSGVQQVGLEARLQVQELRAELDDIKSQEKLHGA